MCLAGAQGRAIIGAVATLELRILIQKAMLAALLASSVTLGAASRPGSAQALPADVASLNPPLLVNRSSRPKTVEVNIVAAPTRLSLMPGKMTEAYAYNGSVPGPTLEVREGDKVIVHFRNDLDEPTTIHWHGIHLPFEADGSPFHPVAPGKSRDYVFTVRPGSAGTYWYHPHPDHRTGFLIAKGLYGGIIVRAADDPLPKSIAEKLLILSDNRLNPDGSIDFPEPRSHHAAVDEENGREGNVLFVSGKVMPTIRIRRGEVQRWRIVNASASRVYRLAMPGHPFMHIGNDGGLFEHPVDAKEIVLGTGERVELLVRGTDKPGERRVLRALPYDRYIPQTRPDDWKTTRDLLTVETTSEPTPAPVLIPAVFRAIPPLDIAKATATRTIVFSQGMINGKKMDMSRVDFTAPLGATEIWAIENVVGMDHPFHLHGFQFQVIDRNGVAEKFRSWKDMVNVPKHETARIIVRYDNYPGKWMFHCHILDHEDHGMMGVLEVK